MSKVKLQIQNLSPVKDELKDAFTRAEAGDIKEEEISLSFESLDALIKVLTPKRYELLNVLKRDLVKANVAQIARALQRDYKNVSTDLKALDDAGLVERTDGSYIVPYDVIESKWRIGA